MNFDILTLFPDIIYDYAAQSIVGRAESDGLISIKAHNFREFSNDKHRRVDDKPYGGGPGMILRVEPIYECLKDIKALKHKNIKTKNSRVQSPESRVILLDPAGKKFDQRMAEEFSRLDRLVFICGRYEGFDARVYDFVDERISVGDYVLAGGELPALAITEAVSRLIPGVLGNSESLVSETHNVERITRTNGATGYALRATRSTREHPQYTRPENFMGKKVPRVLLSGDHRKINQWRVKSQSY